MSVRTARWLLWLFPSMAGLVMAAVVSSADIVQAIQNSPAASPWLKANAQAVANLAMNVESGGNTTAYNGSCCYGVLQMNRRNIDHYARMSPEEYRALPLQAQINAWAALTTDALKASSVRQLIAMGTFDGRPVDGNLVLACVQLGIGNCQKMINSGRCSGFADRNGTTICSMADGMANTVGQPSSPAPDNGTTPGSGTSTGGWKPSDSCIRDSSGSCLPISEAMRQGFLQGSGVEMPTMKRHAELLAVSLVVLILAANLSALWRGYTDGRLSTSQLKGYVLKGGITLGIVLGVIRWL